MLKYIYIVSLLFMLLLSGCKVDFVSRADNTKVYATGSACGENNGTTEEDATKDLLKDVPLIARELKAYVRTNKTDVNGTVCYDAIVTKREWDRYVRTLKTRQEEIVQYLQKQESVFEYNDKEILIKTALTERRQFNLKLDSAKKLAPVELEPFSLDYETLNNTVNVLPSVAIKVRSCSKNTYYNCEVSFVAEVHDESKLLTYAWDFGDGNTSALQNPRHRFVNEGSYNVSLQVTDNAGLSAFRTIDIVVNKNRVNSTPGNTSLTAYFIVKKKSYEVNADVDFDNRSRSRDSAIKSYFWSFGDGGESTERNPKHRYSSPGKYSVRYKVCNNDDICAYASTNIKIISASNKGQPSTKNAVSKGQKTSKIDAKIGEEIHMYIATHGQPSKKIVNKKGTTKAYKFGNVWLLVKYGKVECAVDENGFKTTLMGQPKKCNWHKRYAQDYMVELQ